MKDPALLFYTSDFLTGTSFFTMEQRGQYITLLCQQHQLGRIPKQHMFDICRTYDSPVWAKFKVDENGLYYNERLETEAARRKSYCISRTKNRNKHMSQHMSPHMSPHMSQHMYGHMETETITAAAVVFKGDTPLEVCNTNNNTYKQPVDNLLITCGKPVDKYSKVKKGFAPPTVEEVREYCQSRKNSIDPQYFVDRNSATGWVDKRGVAYKDWKAVIRIWETYDNTRRTNNARPSSKLPQELTPDL